VILPEFSSPVTLPSSFAENLAVILPEFSSPVTPLAFFCGESCYDPAGILLSCNATGVLLQRFSLQIRRISVRNHQQ